VTAEYYLFSLGLVMISSFVLICAFSRMEPTLTLSDWVMIFIQWSLLGSLVLAALVLVLSRLASSQWA